MTDSEPPSGTKPRVLVVDDDPTITRMLDLMLRKMLFVDVDVANTAFGILNRISDVKPHVVILDVMMPALDGPAVTSLIRADPELAHTKVLLYSALDESALARKASECGADGYAQKGTRPAELAHRIDGWLRT